MPSWIIPLAVGILGTSGIVGLLGVVVQRQNNKNINTATLVGLAMDGLKTTNSDLRAQVTDLRTQVSDLKTYINVLEAERKLPSDHSQRIKPRRPT